MACCEAQGVATEPYCGLRTTPVAATRFQYHNSDLAGWQRTRLPEVPSEAFLTLAPDWVCEVLSPSTALVDRRQKMRIYAEQQVPHVWLVDPLVRSLEVYVLQGEHYSARGTFGDADVVRAPPFEELSLELAALWPNAATAR